MWELGEGYRDTALAWLDTRLARTRAVERAAVVNIRLTDWEDHWSRPRQPRDTVYCNASRHRLSPGGGFLRSTRLDSCSVGNPGAFYMNWKTLTGQRFGGQPIAIAAVALAIVVLGIGSIALWRAYNGTAPETDRAVGVRQLQARTAQASEQLVEKTKGLEATQQESVDQLQVVQDQLQTVRRLLASQQTDTKKLSEQVGTLTQAIDGLRQSFASARASEADADSAPRKRSAKAKPRSSQKH